MSEIRVDNITDEAGTGSPNLPNGLVTPSATVSGTLDVASNIQLDSNGISFDSGSNYLDDYEEGTWAPTYEFINTPTYTTQDGRYIKTGNIVHLYGRIIVSSLDTTDSSAIHIGSLPFSVKFDYDGQSMIASSIATRESTILKSLPSGKAFAGWDFNITPVLRPTTSDGDFIRYNENLNSSGAFIFGFSYLTDS